MQFTIEKSVEVSGVALHGGSEVRMRLFPAGPNTGICFKRDGLLIPALFDRVLVSPLCTLLVDDRGVSVSTVEHFMAACWASRIDNLVVEIEGNEVPILDGSAMPFVRLFAEAGKVRQNAVRKRAFLSKPVEVQLGEAWARLTPASEFSAGIEIDFSAASIGRQKYEFDGSFEDFVSNVAGARTFCMLSDVEAMRTQGKALGGSLDNALVFDGDRVVSPGGLRMEREPARHKMLDAIGDLALLGYHLNGRFESYRPGHRLTNMSLREAVSQDAVLDLETGRPIREEVDLLEVA